MLGLVLNHYVFESLLDEVGQTSILRLRQCEQLRLQASFDLEGDRRVFHNPGEYYTVIGHPIKKYVVTLSA